MIFVYKKWEEFCKALNDKGLQSIPAKDVFNADGGYLVLKHDVETDVPKAYKMAQIESRYGHRGSYYVQAYLMNDPKNVELLSEMQANGHEISYHYDVMDSNKGDIEKAIKEFEYNLELFNKNGFDIVTVCQHGNPVVERVGYTSNRDFFRNEAVQAKYPAMADIMVDFKQKANTEYTYYSDAGRMFKLIFDPINNDLINSDDKNIPYNDLGEILQLISKDSKVILSTHPHRWTASAFSYKVKAFVFKAVKLTAKVLMKVPFLKKLMSRYYYLAKKI